MGLPQEHEIEEELAEEVEEGATAEDKETEAAGIIYMEGVTI